MEDKIDKLEYQISQLKKQLNNVHVAYKEKEYELEHIELEITNSTPEQ